jgi:hypothetical protein
MRAHVHLTILACCGASGAAPWTRQSAKPAVPHCMPRVYAYRPRESEHVHARYMAGLMDVDATPGSELSRDPARPHPARVNVLRPGLSASIDPEVSQPNTLSTVE